VQFHGYASLFVKPEMQRMSSLGHYLGKTTVASTALNRRCLEVMNRWPCLPGRVR